MPIPHPRTDATPTTQYGDKQDQAKAWVEVYCQLLVDGGKARWQINKNGASELHLHSGETYVFGKHGVTRLS